MSSPNKKASQGDRQSLDHFYLLSMANDALQQNSPCPVNRNPFVATPTSSEAQRSRIKAIIQQAIDLVNDDDLL